MLIYHPALDPYHSAFRMLQLLAHDPRRSYDRRTLRILDFYAVFPQLITKIRLPKEHAKRRKQFSARENPYWFSGDPVLVFQRMAPLQETALDLLYAQGLLDLSQFGEGRIQLAREKFQQLELSEPKSVDLEVTSFLVTVLGSLPVHGVGGLKDRTRLLEYRYDSV